MLSVILPVLLAVGSGASIVVQQALNINLRAALSSAAGSGLVSCAVGCVCTVMLILALRDPVPAASVATRIPWWAWSGKLSGTMFFGLAIPAGAAARSGDVLALPVTGQMLSSLAFDHFGWMGLAQRSIDLPKMLGVAMVIDGVVLIRR